MPVKHVNSDSEFRSLFDTGTAGGDKLFLVDYSATWCGPCKSIAPVFEKLSNQYGHRNFQFVHVAVDKCEDASEEQRIKALPTFVFYKNTTSTELARIQGADPKTLESKILSLSPKFEASFAGEGNILGGSATSSSVNAPPTSSSASSSDLSAEELVQIAQATVEYSLSGCCRVGIRFQPGIKGAGGGVLGDGFKPFLRINSTEKVSKLRDFINALLELSGVGGDKVYELRNSYPPAKLDEEKSVAEAGVAGAVVVVKFL